MFDPDSYRDYGLMLPAFALLLNFRCVAFLYKNNSIELFLNVLPVVNNEVSDWLFTIHN